jgi:hypothetical protein
MAVLEWEEAQEPLRHDIDTGGLGGSFSSSFFSEGKKPPVFQSFFLLMHICFQSFIHLIN